MQLIQRSLLLSGLYMFWSVFLSITLGLGSCDEYHVKITIPQTQAFHTSMIPGQETGKNMEIYEIKHMLFQRQRSTTHQGMLYNDPPFLSHVWCFAIMYKFSSKFQKEVTNCNKFTVQPLQYDDCTKKNVSRSVQTQIPHLWNIMNFALRLC